MRNTEKETLEDIIIFSNTKDMNATEIMEKDVEDALRKIKFGKAGGTDGILGEFIKHGGIKLKKKLRKLFEKL
ncbi:hypothetical protein E2C01_028995 [Portunus trituberculatus]|uniref:Uncharacterized protein n=1 Tax=Portunus trituberculatus TaxID=210409 RepID=A0A5B7ELX9_PORTR|nr:hypothetical protein [Portunus trituberculatus]